MLILRSLGSELGSETTRCSTSDSTPPRLVADYMIQEVISPVKVFENLTVKHFKECGSTLAMFLSLSYTMVSLS